MNNEVLEGNRLIAFFMGAKIGNPVGKTEVLINVQDFWSGKSTSTHATKDLQYHKRWDWLMPAWRKLYLLLGDVSITIQNEMGEPESALSYWYRQMEQPITKVLIDPAHKTLVKAITFYNQTQKR